MSEVICVVTVTQVAVGSALIVLLVFGNRQIQSWNYLAVVKVLENNPKRTVAYLNIADAYLAKW